MDFDHWANLTSDSEWSYENVSPYFKKIEDYHGHFVNGEELNYCYQSRVYTFSF